MIILEVTEDKYGKIMKAVSEIGIRGKKQTSQRV